MTTLHSYDLNGNKQSFANWVSNLSPEETPFVSLTKKKKVNQTMYEWQSTNLKHPSEQIRVLEGSPASEEEVTSLRTKTNYTQIFRKVVAVSDTADAVESFGRTKESKYQIEKAAKELKRDIEWAFLKNAHGYPEVSGFPRRTSGFMALCAGRNLLSREMFVPTSFFGVNSSVVGSKRGKPELVDLYKMFTNLYLTGSKADTIMFHPKHAQFFADLQEVELARSRWFENTEKVVIETTTIQDQFGKWWKLVPNRNMIPFSIFFMKPSEWTQRVLRAPRLVKLSKQGSSTKWMIEAEVGLENKDPFGSGVLNLLREAMPQSGDSVWKEASVSFTQEDGAKGIISIRDSALPVYLKEGTAVTFTLQPKDKIPNPFGADVTVMEGDYISIFRDGSFMLDHPITKEEADNKKIVLKLTDSFKSSNSSTYLIVLYRQGISHGLAYTGTVPLVAKHY